MGNVRKFFSKENFFIGKNAIENSNGQKNLIRKNSLWKKRENRRREKLSYSLWIFVEDKNWLLANKSRA